ncbi:MAG: phosphotransferase [Bdellovibrionaceae bacterium]|nr:phosphotransferase [Pseudobdellovibrionaceae bacterium]
MQNFLKNYFLDLKDLKTISLKGDGGHRSYKRLIKGNKTFILMSCGLKDPSLKLFVDIQKRLKSYVLVPRIFQLDFEKGFLLLEDLGDKNLEHVFLKGNKSLQFSFYKKALKQLINLQDQIHLFEQDPLFDVHFFLNEIERALYDIEKYFYDVLNQRSFSKELLKNFKTEMQELLSHFKMEDLVYCHRDFHSRNLMIKDNKVVMIDFQDAGKGPWYYDLSSLLYDSYVFLENKEELARFYFENLSLSLKTKAQSLTRVQWMVKLQFLQRGFKACGRFCAFKTEDNKDTHLKYLKPTFHLLKQTAKDMKYRGICDYIDILLQTLK